MNDKNDETHRVLPKEWPQSSQTKCVSLCTKKEIGGSGEGYRTTLLATAKVTDGTQVGVIQITARTKSGLLFNNGYKYKCLTAVIECLQQLRADIQRELTP